MGTFRQKVQATTNWTTSDLEDLAEAPKPSLFSRIRNTSSERAYAEPASLAGSRPAAKRRRKAPQPPVTAHRLFPAFSAVWFAALFGLGSLAVSGEVLGALVVKSGLPALVPAAAPPLGFTAHLLVAFALTLVGAALGLVLGLRLRPQSSTEAAVVAAPAPVAEPEAVPAAVETYKVRARDAHPDAPPRRPLVLTEAFDDPIGDAIADSPAAEPEEAEGPLLRRKPWASLADETAAESAPWLAPGAQASVEPLDLSALDLPDPAEETVIEEPVIEEPIALAADEPGTAHGTEPELPATTAADAEAAPVPYPAAPTLIAGTPQLPAGYAATLPEAPNGGWSPVAGAPLENLGLVQLIERLALAMAARKATDEGGSPQAEAAPEPATPELHADVPEADVPEADMPEAFAAGPEFTSGPFSRPQPPAGPEEGTARDTILRRLGAMAAGDFAAGQNAGSDGAPPFSRPAAGKATAEGVVSLHQEQGADRTAPAFAAPAGATVPFETDVALRSALATLQRMTARG